MPTRKSPIKHVVRSYKRDYNGPREGGFIIVRSYVRGHGTKPKKTVTIPHYLKRAVDISGKELSENDIRLWKNRLNAGTMEYDDIPWPEDERGYRLTPEQNEKGHKFLLSQWKGKSGRERENSPFGYREQDALENFEEIKLVDFYKTPNGYWIPYYRVVGKNNDFEYYWDGRQVNILG